MKRPLTKITSDVLEQLGACAPGLQTFNEVFPQGWEPTVETALLYAGDLNWDWGAQELLNGFGRQAYTQQKSQAQSDYTSGQLTMLNKIDPLRQPELYDIEYSKLRGAYVEACARAFVEQFLTNPILFDDGVVSNPDEALGEIRETLNSDSFPDMGFSELNEFRRKLRGLDDYLSHGGKLPDAWNADLLDDPSM